MILFDLKESGGVSKNGLSPEAKYRVIFYNVKDLVFNLQACDLICLHTQKFFVPCWNDVYNYHESRILRSFCLMAEM